MKMMPQAGLPRREQLVSGVARSAAHPRKRFEKLVLWVSELGEEL